MKIFQKEETYISKSQIIGFNLFLILNNHLLSWQFFCFFLYVWIFPKRYRTILWFQIGKGEHQGCLFSPCLFNLHAVYIMWNARLDEPQTAIKTAWRNTNNLRYTDGITFMAESEEELKKLDESERGEWKRWLKTQHSKN